MTTDIELLVAEQAEAAESALAETEAFFHSVEARFSRFLPDSELSQLNAGGRNGEPVPVSDDMAELLNMALAAARRTGGVFDLTVIDALEAAGYDRSIDLVRAQGAHRHALPAAGRPGRWHDIRVERGPAGWTVVRPAGQRIDLGGIAKGWAADRAGALLQPLGAGLVNAGGDLRAWGDQPGAGSGKGWLVALDDPQQEGTDVAWLRVVDGAAATSTTTNRRWAGGHHLIDPRTGNPADSDLLSVTVLGPTVAEAEVAAKVALVLGRDYGLAWLAEQNGVAALMVGADGQYYGTPGIEDFLA